MFRVLSILGIGLLILLPKSHLDAYYPLGEPKGYVNDYAKLLMPGEQLGLSGALEALEDDIGAELVFVTIDSLKGDSIENFAIELFADWGIGKKGQDNGVLVLISKNDKKVRIEVGYGLEPLITDIESKHFIDEATPYIKDAKYIDGIGLLMSSLAEQIRDGKIHAIPEDKSYFDISGKEMLIFFAFLLLNLGMSSLMRVLGSTKTWWLGGVIGVIFGVVLGSWLMIMGLGILGLIIDYLVSKKGITGTGDSWWGGGWGGGGGFGVFGGGRSGGGGASGSW